MLPPLLLCDETARRFVSLTHIGCGVRQKSEPQQLRCPVNILMLRTCSDKTMIGTGSLPKTNVGRASAVKFWASLVIMQLEHRIVINS